MIPPSSQQGSPDWGPDNKTCNGYYPINIREFLFQKLPNLKLWSCCFILSCLQDINLETIEISFEQKDSKEASPFFCNIIMMTNYFFPLGKAAQKYSGNNTFSLTWRLSSLHPHRLHPFNHRKIIIWQSSEKLRERRATQQSRDCNLAIILVSTVVMFFLCHLPRVVTRLISLSQPLSNRPLPELCIKFSEYIYFISWKPSVDLFQIFPHLRSTDFKYLEYSNINRLKYSQHLRGSQHPFNLGLSRKRLIPNQKLVHHFIHEIVYS